MSDGERHGEHSGKLRRSGGRWGITLMALLVIFAGIAAYDLISNWGDLNGHAAVSATPERSVATSARTSPAASASSTASASPSMTTSPAPEARVLTAMSAVAFGPNGTADGDHPQLASRVIDGGAGMAWMTSWYKTADFGRLRAGTGVLLDMGRTVAVTSVRVVLSTTPGASLQLRIGDSARSAALTTAASASDAAGTVLLRPGSTVRGRYVLIWFTKLPRDAAGTYQVSVYDVAVSGYLP